MSAGITPDPDSNQINLTWAGKSQKKGDKMKKFITMLVVGLFMVVGVGQVFAAQASKSEAQALVEKAALFIKQNGKDKAIAEFNNPKGAFVDRDLYIFAYDFKGVNKALVSSPGKIGQNLLEMKDADGKFLIKDLIDVANQGGGWYTYKWANPSTNQIQNKASYVIKIDDNLWIGSGVYL